MKIESIPKQGMIALSIPTRQKLYEAYMPFIENGGLFVPTEQSFDMGEDVFLLLTLMDEPQRYAVSGKVVWITPIGALGGRMPGIGVQFVGVEGSQVQQRIETYLAGSLDSDNLTNTM